DLTAACKLDLLERGADAGELKFDGLFLGHLAERLELIEAREPYLAPIICLGFELCNYCLGDDYCGSFVFTGFYHRGYASVDEDACIWYQYHKIFFLHYSMVLYTICSTNGYVDGTDMRRWGL